MRHAPEILGSCALSAVVSMGGTAALCRLSGLDPSELSSLSWTSDLAELRVELPETRMKTAAFPILQIS